jgi:hypothetical protein
MIKKSQTKLTTRWIENTWFPDDRLTAYNCENCDKALVTDNVKEFKYCHGCGAKVTEVI